MMTGDVNMVCGPLLGGAAVASGENEVEDRRCEVSCGRETGRVMSLFDVFGQILPILIRGPRQS